MILMVPLLVTFFSCCDHDCRVSSHRLRINFHQLLKNQLATFQHRGKHAHHRHLVSALRHAKVCVKDLFDYDFNDGAAAICIIDSFVYNHPVREGKRDHRNRIAAEKESR